jgi:hypothetical protein
MQGPLGHLRQACPVQQVNHMLPGELHRNHLLCEIAVPYNLALRSGAGAAAWRQLASYRLQPALVRGPRGVMAEQNPHPGIPGTTSRRSYR